VTAAWTGPSVCLDEHLAVDDGGLLRLEPWSVPRLVWDTKTDSIVDGQLKETIALPGKLMIENSAPTWANDSPVDQMVLIRIIRSWKSWLTSNPNAIQFRDRWTWAIDRAPAIPVTTGVFNSQCGSAIDVGTNTVAEPNPGRQWMWAPVTMADEWVGPLTPGQRINLHYRCYVWTPPPWSNNANKASPQHEAAARYTRIQLLVFPQQGNVVVG
jgi:hypothetical protein